MMCVATQKTRLFVTTIYLDNIKMLWQADMGGSRIEKVGGTHVLTPTKCGAQNVQAKARQADSNVGWQLVSACLTMVLTC